MLFNSLIFIFAFMPIALIGYYVLCATTLNRFRFGFLSLMSMVFYAWASWKFALLLFLSTAANLGLAKAIESHRNQGRAKAAKTTLMLGLIANLLFLCYFKYTDFIIANVNMIAGANIPLPHIFLPLGISFYTFLFMASLADTARGEIGEVRSSHFVSFSLFFPHLLAGPIVHYQELVPQMVPLPRWSHVMRNMTVGTAIFAIGLFKKVVIADTLSLYTDPIFAAADAGHHPGMLMSWLAAMNFTLQLYFDFSGYSDMAIGISHMFGFRLPPNFHSPLKASNIVDFWRRWHMTLQRFIVAYLYPPVAVACTRWSIARELSRFPDYLVALAFPTIATFVVVGAWHGSGWNYVVFGLMHGIYISVCEGWRMLFKKKKKKGVPPPAPGPWYLHQLPAHLITLVAVFVAFVVFRSSTLDSAWTLCHDMIGLGTADAPVATVPALAWPTNILLVALGFLFALALPNTQQLMTKFSPVLGWEKWRQVSPPAIRLTFRRTLPWASAIGIILFLGILFISRSQAVFIYFKF